MENIFIWVIAKKGEKGSLISYGIENEEGKIKETWSNFPW